MYTHTTTPSGAPVHAYALGDGHTLNLNPQEQKALERLQHQLSNIAQRLLDVGVAADPRAPAPTKNAFKVIESLITDAALWFLSVDPKKLAKDHDMAQQPLVRQDMLRRIHSVTLAEAKLIQNAVCTSRQLWRELCTLADSPDFNPDAARHPQVYDDVRMRIYPWINTINRALESRLMAEQGSSAPQAAEAAEPAKSTTPRTAPARPARPAPPRPPALAKPQASPPPQTPPKPQATSKPQAPQRPPRATPQQAALVAQAAREIRTLHEWRGLGGEIVPHVIVTLPGWPTGCSLHIRNMQGAMLDEFGPPLGAGKAPVTLLLNAGEGHYSAHINGQRVPVPAGGDCFYRAILAGMSTPDRSALLESVGADPAEPYSADSMSKLREATSGQLAAAPARFGPLLELMQMAEG